MSIHFRTRTVSYNLPLDTMFGACCTDNSCAETTAASCYENPNGRFFHNLSCDDINCEFGVCCNNGLCSETTEEGCIAQGGEFIGKEYDCLTYNCSGTSSEFTQACCFSDNVCEDLEPSVCLSRGGVPRGPNSSCAIINAAGGCGVTGATAHGVCCVGGQCLSPQGFDPNGVYHEFGYTAGDCAALGGLFGGSGSTCGAGTSFGTSYPCVFPTGSCCFGNSPAGGITYCENGKTYGDCLNPPTLGGSGGAGWFAGQTCGQLQETNICTAGDFVEDVACCVPFYRDVTHDGVVPPVDNPILVNYNCINTSTTACELIGGISNPDGKLCEEVDCCTESYQPPCEENTLGTLSEFITNAQGSVEIICTDTSLVGSLDIRDAFIEANEICPTCDIVAYTTTFSEERPTYCDPEQETPYVAFNCVWRFNTDSNRYEFYECDERQFLESETPFNSLTSPLSPDRYTGGDFIFSPIRLSPYTEVGIPETCNLCNAVTPTNWIGACCSGSDCNTVVSSENCDGDFYLSKQCTLNCDSLPCCDASGLYYKNCFSKSAWNTDFVTLEQNSGCHDRFDLIGTEPLANNMISYALSLGVPITIINQYPDTDGTDCESCDAPCSRNRGTCCLNGRSIYNVTSDECTNYGGLFKGCEGRPYLVPSSGGFNFAPVDSCESNEGFAPPDTPKTPTIQRGVAVASQNNLLYFRRGPFNSTTQIENAINDTPEYLNANDRRMGVFGDTVLPEHFPNKPLVQIFWGSPEENNSAQRNFQGGAAGDIVNLCENYNLPNCNFNQDVLGTCCIQIRCADGDIDTLDDDIVDCYTCVENVSDCECAALNNARSCGEHDWLPNVEESEYNRCENCVCTDVDRSRYQVDDGCIDESTPINNRNSEIPEEGND
jgi:hypothetical protein